MGQKDLGIHKCVGGVGSGNTFGNPHLAVLTTPTPPPAGRPIQTWLEIYSNGTRHLILSLAPSSTA